MSPSWILIITTLICGPEALRVQKLSIFSENCCKGKSEQYDKNVRNLSAVSMTVSQNQMQSFSIHHGLWALSRGVNHSEGGIYYEGNSDDLHGNCGSSASAGGGAFIQYKSIRLVGNAYLDVPGLSLFTAEAFQGEELYFDGTNLRLPSPYVFKSYGFTARDNWTVFPLTNFSGGSSCLIAQHKPVSFVHKGTTITLGSIQRGCTSRHGRKSVSRVKGPHVHQALLLFREVNQTGERLTTDGLELRLPLPLSFGSYSFVGTKNWTIFSGTDLSGHTVCLYNPNTSQKPAIQSKSTKGTAITLAMTVGSIRRGCDTDPVRETVSIQPETSEHQVDMTGGGTMSKYYVKNGAKETFIIVISIGYLWNTVVR